MENVVIAGRKDIKEMSTDEKIDETLLILRRFEDALENLSNSPMFAAMMPR